MTASDLRPPPRPEWWTTRRQRVYDPRQLGERIILARGRLGLSRPALADRLGLGDWGAQSVRRWEQGRAIPSAENLALLAVALDVSADVLLFGGAS